MRHDNTQGKTDDRLLRRFINTLKTCLVNIESNMVVNVYQMNLTEKTGFALPRVCTFLLQNCIALQFLLVLFVFFFNFDDNLFEKQIDFRFICRVEIQDEKTHMDNDVLLPY